MPLTPESLEAEFARRVPTETPTFDTETRTQLQAVIDSVMAELEPLSDAERIEYLEGMKEADPDFHDMIVHEGWNMREPPPTTTTTPPGQTPIETRTPPTTTTMPPPTTTTMPPPTTTMPPPTTVPSQVTIPPTTTMPPPTTTLVPPIGVPPWDDRMPRIEPLTERFSEPPPPVANQGWFPDILGEGMTPPSYTPGTGRIEQTPTPQSPHEEQSPFSAPNLAEKERREMLTRIGRGPFPPVPGSQAEQAARAGSPEAQRLANQLYSRPTPAQATMGDVKGGLGDYLANLQMSGTAQRPMTASATPYTDFNPATQQQLEQWRKFSMAQMPPRR